MERGERGFAIEASPPAAADRRGDSASRSEGFFISYRREDSDAEADRLYDLLSKQFGRDVAFMDVNTVQPGVDFTRIIERHLRECQVLLAIIAAVAIGAFVEGLDAAPAGVRQTTSGLRMYVFNCGTLKDRSPQTYNLTRDQVESVDMADPCFLIVHPRGSLLWETGLNDAQYNTPGGFGPRHDIVEKSLKSQLAAVGYTADKITYLAMSHWHGDHAGNANDYAASTWIVQRAEQEAMFQAPAAQTPAGNSATFSALKSSKAIVVDGDHDVFGDGAVIVKPTPGHTPGHQSLFVKLPRTGPLVLSGDLYHFPAERTFGKMPSGEAERGQTAVSRQRLEEFIKMNKAQLWIQHDMIGYRKIKLAPQYYE